MASVMGMHATHRGRLDTKSMAMEIFLHYNGPLPNAAANELITRALNTKFGGTNWNFVNTNSKRKSQVLGRTRELEGRIKVTKKKKKIMETVMNDI